jgi:hypothetical protein
VLPELDVLPELLVVEEAEVVVLDLLSDDAVDFESALPPSLDVLVSDVLDSEVLAAGVDSFAPDSDDAAFLRASDG